jgi:hypothetical protein
MRMAAWSPRVSAASRQMKRLPPLKPTFPLPRAGRAWQCPGSRRRHSRHPAPLATQSALPADPTLPPFRGTPREQLLRQARLHHEHRRAGDDETTREVGVDRMHGVPSALTGRCWVAGHLVAFHLCRLPRFAVRCRECTADGRGRRCQDAARRSCRPAAPRGGRAVDSREGNGCMARSRCPLASRWQRRPPCSNHGRRSD